ncbi:MAG: hypothetical protein KBT34_12880 [Prevotella sp.]|nr:hypothetical protein [Candidatus Prevotella equi]
MAFPLMLFVLLSVTFGLPDTTVITSESFILQFIMTLLTIIAIPVLLWFVRRERFKKEETYKSFLITRMCILASLTMLNTAAYFFLPNASFYYLAVMTYLSMFFARK